MSYRSGPTFGGVCTFILFWCMFFILPLAYIETFNWLKATRYKIGCEGHLKLAANSNSPEIASKELDAALKYCQEHHLTEGSSHVCWATPSTDVGFWYGNLKSANDDLKSLSVDAQPMEKSNMLIKLRETILDHGKDGEYVADPDYIWQYPDQATYYWGSTIAGVWLIIGCLIAFIIENG